MSPCNVGHQSACDEMSYILVDWRPQLHGCKKHKNLQCGGLLTSPDISSLLWYFTDTCTDYITHDRGCVMPHSCPHNVTNLKRNTFNIKEQYSESLATQWHKVSLHCVLLWISSYIPQHWNTMIICVSR